MALWKDWFGGRRSGEEVPAQLHESILAQALKPVFFGAGLIPDTFGGRFENATIHAVMLFRRLRRIETIGPELAQEVFGELFSGFDDALREIGTGDLRVGKKIKDIAQAFYGRAEVYDAALAVDAQTDNSALVDALMRNVRLEADGAERFARYMRSIDEALAGQSDETLLQGRVEWPSAF